MDQHHAYIVVSVVGRTPGDTERLTAELFDGLVDAANGSMDDARMIASEVRSRSHAAAELETGRQLASISLAQDHGWARQ